jgi:hypothetical protein
LWQEECREGSGIGGPSRGGVFGRGSRESAHNSRWVASSNEVPPAAAAAAAAAAGPEAAAADPKSTAVELCLDRQQRLCPRQSGQGSR